MIPHNPDWAVWTRWPSRRLACGLSRDLALRDELGNNYNIFLSSPTWKNQDKGVVGNQITIEILGLGGGLNKTLTEAFLCNRDQTWQSGQLKWA